MNVSENIIIKHTYHTSQLSRFENQEYFGNNDRKDRQAVRGHKEARKGTKRTFISLIDYINLNQSS